MNIDGSLIYRRFRYFFRLQMAFLKKYRWQVSLAGILVVVFFNLPAKFWIFKLPRSRVTDTIGIVGRFNITSLPLSLQKKLSIGLTTVDSQGLPKAGIAETWDATAGGLLYYFHLNRNMVWADGRQVKASDLNLKFANATVSYPDNNTVAIKLENFPFSPLPVLLSKPQLKKTSLIWPEKIPYVGVGSYKIGSFKQNGDTLNEITLMPTDKDSQLPILKYRFYPTQALAATAFKLGEVKSLEEISEPNVLQNFGKTYLREIPQYDKVIAVVFNYTGKVLGGSGGRNMRMALSYTIDKSGFEYRASGPIPPNSWAYVNANKLYGYDPDKAQLLYEKTDNPPKNLILNTFPAYLDTAEKIKSDWGKIGLKVEVTSVTEVPDNFEAMLMPLPLLADPDQYHLWHSTSEVQNYANFNNPRIDKLLEDGRKESNMEKRKAIYADFQKYLMEEAPAVFLYYPVEYTISRS